MKSRTELVPVNVTDVDDEPLADSPESGSVPALILRLTLRMSKGQAPGIAPEKSGDGCFCDRLRWSLRPCGHCTRESEGDDGGANPIWRRLTEWEQESWCGCAAPGRDVLPCGHCACGNGLCLELVNVGPGRPFAKRRKASCG